MMVSYKTEDTQSIFLLGEKKNLGNINSETNRDSF